MCLWKIKTKNDQNHLIFILFFILNIIAAITPGAHPAQVKQNVIIIAPHPLSITAKGGKNRHNKTLITLIVISISI